MTQQIATSSERMHALDAVRGFALLLGVVFHTTISFLPGFPPGIWAINDNSPSEALGLFGFVAHSFRMTLFFLIAGFFAHLVFHRKGASRFWGDRSKRILVPMIVGWMVLFPAFMLVWGWGRSVQFPDAPAPDMAAAMGQAPAGWFPLLHLWFLYYLMVLYVAVISVRSIIVYFDRKHTIRNFADQVVKKIVARFWFGPLLGLPLALVLTSISYWSPSLGIPTPDQSIIPQLPAMIGFGSAFVFGWLLHRQTELLKVWEQRWSSYLTAAIAFSVFCLVIISPTFAPDYAGSQLILFGGALAYTLTIWTWVFAITGAALKFLNKESPVIRYVADSSYWIYLAHLPIVAAMQVAVGTLPLHWTIKFPLVLAVSFAVLFGTYYLFVRSTFIGKVLNGRKYPRNLPVRVEKSVDQAEQQVPLKDSNVLARLQDVHKSFGKNHALNGVTLEVKRGELLALLGPNGAGKSTAINLWLGLQQATSGIVELMGGAPEELDNRRAVGVMMQELKMETTLKAHELVNLAASNYPNPMSIEEAMQITQTTAFANKQYSKLSVGQRRQVQIAMAICGRPQLLFLDEPTVGLDVQAREALWQCIRNLLAQNCAIVLTTHYLEEAETLANRVAVLAHGNVVATGTVAEIRGLVSRKKISCSSSVSADDIRNWPDVVDVSFENDKFIITARNAEAVVRRLLQEDANLQNLEVKQAGLADAFVELVKEAA